MKYINRCLFIIVSLLLLSIVASAYPNQSKHHMMVSLAGGYSGYLHDYTAMHSIYSSNWDVFFGYEYEHSHFITQSGLGLRANLAVMGMDNYQTSLYAYDTQGKMFEYTYSFLNRTDQSLECSLNIPLLMGAKFSCVYFLAGIVNHIQLYENYEINTQLTCTGHYDRYVGDYGGMDNHAFYTNEPVTRQTNKSHIRPQYQLYPYLEFGVDIVELAERRSYRSHRSTDMQIRIAAYAHMATLNTYVTPTYSDPYLTNRDYPFDLSKIQIPAMCNTQHVAQSYLYDWTVGLRLSLIFDVSRSSRFCITCDYR